MLVSNVGSPVGICLAIAYTDHNIPCLVASSFKSIQKTKLIVGEVFLIKLSERVSRV